MKKSMYTDEEFCLLKQSFERGDLDKSEENLQKMIKDFKEEIENNYREWHSCADPEKQEIIKMACMVLVQGYNFLAKCLCDDEIDYPDFKEITWDPTWEKYYAIFIDEGMVGKALKQTFSLMLDEEKYNYRYVEKYSELMEGIMANKILGVLAFHMSKKGYIQSSIRHDLKNRPGWNYEKAEKYPLPPCSNVPYMAKIDEILDSFSSLMEDKKVEVFCLEQNLEILLKYMTAPAKDRKLLIIDDTESEIAGMKIILERWPRIEVKHMIVEEKLPFTHVLGEDYNPDIILLDDNMGVISGRQVFLNLKENDFAGVVVSITGGSKPDYTNIHFQGKSLVKKDFEAAKDFCLMISELIHKNNL